LAWNYLHLQINHSSEQVERKQKMENNENIKEKVEKALEKVRPALQRDGGDVSLIEVSEEGEVKVRLMGHCHGCPFSQMTVKNLVERVIKQEVPEITSVTSA
jgi:Fe-S cluster biogenesis protein NfuA